MGLKQNNLLLRWFIDLLMEVGALCVHQEPRATASAGA